MSRMKSNKTSGSFSRKIASEGRFNGIMAGWGSQRMLIAKASVEGEASVIMDTNEPGAIKHAASDKNVTHSTPSLGALPSVAIAGCDLLSSCLYTAGVCASNCGKLAPIGLVLVTAMLFYFKDVYCEVVTAIPVNGGTCKFISIAIQSRKYSDVLV
jgi:hypothetical protein